MIITTIQDLRSFYMGMERSGLEKLILKAYKLLNLITFYTPTDMRRPYF